MGRDKGPSIDWRAHFKPGDVIRSRDGRDLGVVMYVGRYRDDPPLYELHVDMPEQGVGLWPPEDAVVANDSRSVAEARRLGLRFPGDVKSLEEDRLPEGPCCRSQRDATPHKAWKEPDPVDWQAHFKSGDVVKNKDGPEIGVVVNIGRYRDDPPLYRLYVDTPGDGIVPWRAESVILANDPESVAEARRLGLRGLPPEGQSTSSMGK